MTGLGLFGKSAQKLLFTRACFAALVVATSGLGTFASGADLIRAPRPLGLTDTDAQKAAEARIETASLNSGSLNPAGLDTRAIDWDSPAGDPAALPTPLSAKDAALYVQIFDLQQLGKWRAADRLIAQLDDRLLLGHIGFQRLMHPTAYRSTYAELKEWMASYADHPGADRIYKLALTRKPSNWKYPRKPQNAIPRDVSAALQDASTGGSQNEVTGGSSAFNGQAETPKKPYRSAAIRGEIRTVQRSIRRWVQRGSVTKAYEYLSQNRFQRIFDPISYGESLGVIARGYFRYHKDAEAVEIARQAAERAGDTATNAFWWGGLAAFRLGDFTQSAALFELLARSPYADGEDRSGGAYWASRAYLHAGIPHLVNPMLTRAAEVQRSFYGMLALRALGFDPSFDWDLPHLTLDQAELLRRIPAANRALALIQVGQSVLAEAELKRFAQHLPANLAQMLLAMADRAGLADLSYRVGAAIERKHGITLDAALYPSPGWQPDGGWTVDRALVFALIRQESRFRPDAKSRAGARGLMQLMPATAGFVAKRRFRGSARNELLDPGLNLRLGQDYVKMLLSERQAGENIFFTMTAYNGGPGNLQKWLKKVDHADDPLLFIESIPSRETRNYVEHVLANLWIYRHKMGQEAPTLDALIAGRWPVYIPQDPNLNGEGAVQTAGREAE